MIRKKFLLIAAAALSLPTVAWAAPKAARNIVVIPAGFVSLPAFQPVLLPVSPAPSAMIREMALMQEQMQANMLALQRLTFQPIMPGAKLLIPAGGSGVTQVSMMSFSGPKQVCGETITVLSSRNGKPKISVRHIGSACTPLPAAMLAPVSPTQVKPGPAKSVPPMPAGALPPPSKLIYAKYEVPLHTARQST